MRIGFLVDGQAEFRSLPRVFSRITTPHTLLAPLYADIQPFAPAGQVIGAVRSKIPLLLSRRVDRAVVLIDRETRADCPSDLARLIEQGLAPLCARNGMGVVVVVKDTAFENWLISDPNAINQLAARFALTAAQREHIETRCDRIDASAILKRAAQGDSYDKVPDAVRLMARADPQRMAENSRSFRRLLRVIGDPQYVDQSRRPAAPRGS